MQISVTATGGLERRIEVAIPAATVDGQVKQRLQNISRTARLNGFRPGKAPYAVIQKQYGQQVHGEVVSELMRSSFSEAVAQEKLSPATGPRIEPITVEPGNDLKYAAIFEVMPEIKLRPFDELTIERPTAAVTDADLEAMLETLRKQRPTYTEVDREARDTDRAIVDFVGMIDGAEFDGGKGQTVPVIVGAKRVMTEFEDAVRGARAGDTKNFEATFPADHANKGLAGKLAKFTVTIKKVEEQSLPALDDAFATDFGIAEGGLAQLRNEVRANMERELNEAVRVSVRGQVLEGLYRANPVELPRTMVDEQIQELQVDMFRRMGVKDIKELPPREPFEEPARRRVALGLIMGEVVRGSELKVSRERVHAKLNEIASAYPNADEVRRGYLQNADAMRQIESQVLEDQAIEWLVERAKVSDKASSFSELTRFGQQAQQEMA